MDEGGGTLGRGPRSGHRRKELSAAASLSRESERDEDFRPDLSTRVISPREKTRKGQASLPSPTTKRNGWTAPGQFGPWFHAQGKVADPCVFPECQMSP